MKFQPGNHYAKLGGRPRNARNKLASSVFNDVTAVWNEPVSEGNPLTKGKAAMLAMCRTKPAEFVKAVFGIMPREFVFESVLTDLSDDELFQKLEEYRERRQRLDANQPALIEHVPEDPQNVHC
jgi:hypothetical protein